MEIHHSLKTHLDTRKTNLLIFSLGPTKMVGAYRHSCVNLKEYAFTYKLPCPWLVNSCNMASLISREINYQRKQNWPFPHKMTPIFRPSFFLLAEKYFINTLNLISDQLHLFHQRHSHDLQHLMNLIYELLRSCPCEISLSLLMLPYPHLGS